MRVSWNQFATGTWADQAGYERWQRSCAGLAILVTAGLYAWRSDHSAHFETIWQRVKAICGITADTIMLQPFPSTYAFSRWMTRRMADTP